MTDLPPADDGARRAAQPPKRGSWGIRLAGAALLLVLLAVSALIALRTEGGWRNVDARIEALQPVSCAEP